MLQSRASQTSLHTKQRTARRAAFRVASAATTQTWLISSITITRRRMSHLDEPHLQAKRAHRCWCRVSRHPKGRCSCRGRQRRRFCPSTPRRCARSEAGTAGSSYTHDEHAWPKAGELSERWLRAREERVSRGGTSGCLPRHSWSVACTGGWQQRPKCCSGHRGNVKRNERSVETNECLLDVVGWRTGRAPT